MDNNTEMGNKISTQVIHFPESGIDTLKVSYFADTVIYVPLETTKESFVDNIKQAWMNDSIILLGCYQAGLLMFQQNGKFIRKIGKDGRGPGEYTTIFHFDVIRDTIYISSSGKRSLMKFTMDGVFCEELQLKYQPVYFTSTSDGKLACYDHNLGKILIYNTNNHIDTIIVEYGVTKGRYYFGFSDPNMIYLPKTSTGLLFTSYLNDTLWTITGDKKEPTYILDLKGELLPYEKQIEFCNGDLVGWEEISKSYNIIYPIPYSSYMFFYQKNYYDQGYDAIYIYDTSLREITKFNTPFFYDDLIGKQKLYHYPFLYSTQYLLTYYSSATGLIKTLKQVELNKNSVGSSQLWLEQMKKVKESDNPILAIIKKK